MEGGGVGADPDLDREFYSSATMFCDGQALEITYPPKLSQKRPFVRRQFYPGMSDEGRKSFRDVRAYRRRKRWLELGASPPSPTAPPGLPPAPRVRFVPLATFDSEGLLP